MSCQEIDFASAFYFMVQWQYLQGILLPRQGDDRGGYGGFVAEQVYVVCFVLVCTYFKEGRGDGGCAPLHPPYIIICF